MIHTFAPMPVTTATPTPRTAPAVPGVVKKCICLPPKTLAAAKRRAKAAGRNFSSYMAWLITRDAEVSK